MKTKYLLFLGAVAAFGSCTSAYRIGQTPDDVYYSPAPPQNEYVTSYDQQDKSSYSYNNNNVEDLAIRRGINDPQFRSNLSFYLGSGYYPYDSYGSSFYNPYNSYYNPYDYTGITFYPYNNFYSPYNNFYSPYNNFYSPYYNSYSPYYNSFYSPLYYNTKPSNSVSNYRGPRQFNLRPYNVNPNTNSTTPAANNSSMPVRTFRPQPTTGVGNFVRRIFTPSNNNNNRSNNNYYNNNTRSNNSYYDNNTRSNNNFNNNTNNNNAPARTFQPDASSGNSNSSSSGSGSGSAPVRTFRH